MWNFIYRFKFHQISQSPRIHHIERGLEKAFVWNATHKVNRFLQSRGLDCRPEEKSSMIFSNFLSTFFQKN